MATQGVTPQGSNFNRALPTPTPPTKTCVVSGRQYNIPKILDELEQRINNISTEMIKNNNLDQKKTKDVEQELEKLSKGCIVLSGLVGQNSAQLSRVNELAIKISNLQLELTFLEPKVVSNISIEFATLLPPPIPSRDNRPQLSTAEKTTPAAPPAKTAPPRPTSPTPALQSASPKPATKKTPLPVTIDATLHPDTKEAISNTKAIAQNYTRVTPIGDQQKAHENAKDGLRKILPKVSNGASVDFISSPKLETPLLENVKIPARGKLSKKVFSFQYTSDVKKDIQKDGKRKEDNIIIYGVSSQFNSAESVEVTTPKPGTGVEKYLRDPTHGPAAQLANDKNVLENILVAANRGLNGLCKVFNANTKSAVKHGYLSPNQDQIKEVNNQLRENGDKIEYTCVESIPQEGKKPVHQVYVAAPDCKPGRSDLATEDPNNSDLKELQFLCALNAFRAQFSQAVKLANENNKPVVLKAVGVGLGDFNNDPEVVAKAFYQAGIEFEKELEANNVQVKLQIFKPDIKSPADPNVSRMAKVIGLSKSK